MFNKIFQTAMLALLVTAVTACGGSSKSSSSGGSKLAAPPTDRPTLTGMTTVIDARGGSGTGTTSGSNGGDVYVVVAGEMIPGNGPSRPSVSNNIISAASLADDVVTYAELETDAGSSLEITGSTAYLHLYGNGFFVPSGATLDLSDAPLSVSDFVVYAHMPTDRIRISGTVVTARAANQAVAVSLYSGSAEGLAIVVDGELNTSAASDGGAASATLWAFRGSIAIGGSISARGPDGASPGAGRDVFIATDRGNLYLRPGMVDSSGGNGQSTGNGGRAGALYFYVNGMGNTTDFRWGIRGNGGNGGAGAGTSGGRGADLEWSFGGDVDFFSVVEINGGSGEQGSRGGDFDDLYANRMRGVLVIHSNGGSGTSNNGARGGDHDFQVSRYESLALIINANGGDSQSGNGGRGGELYELEAYAGWFNQVLLEYTAHGGDSVSGSGGTGGYSEIYGYSDFIDSVFIVAANGGNSVSGDGGGTDEHYLYCSGESGSLKNVEWHVVANGGIGGGGEGGSGAYVELYLSSTLRFGEVYIAAQINGGSGDVEGGSGGYLYLQANGISTLDVTMDVSANGGDSEVSPGSGGTLETDSSGSYILRGSFVARGGMGLDSASGDTGGTVTVRSGNNELGTLYAIGFSADLRGGDSEGGQGGDGGDFVSVGEFTPVLFTNVMIDVSGGDGSTVSGTSRGGHGGEIDLYSAFSDPEYRGTLLARGGTGVDGGNGGNIGIFGDFWGDGWGGYVYVSAQINVSGGHARAGSNGDGGDAGEAGVFGYDTDESFAVGAIEVHGAIWANGGNGDGTGDGGRGGLIEIGDCRTFLMCMATLQANGGNGNNGGQGGEVEFEMDLFAANIGSLTIGGNIYANGGNGTNEGGDGGSIVANADNDGGTITVNSGVTLRANGGTDDGDAGFITLTADGTGNVTTTGATLQTLDGDGTDQGTNNITID